MDRAERERLLLAALPALFGTAKRLCMLPPVRNLLGGHWDVFQQAALLAWDKGFNQPNPPCGWTAHLCTTARMYVVKHAFRRAKRTAFAAVHGTAPVESVAFSRHNEIALANARMDAETVCCGLVDRDRVILLRDGTLDDAAALLGEPASSVKDRSVYLLRTLRVRLGLVEHVKRPRWKPGQPKKATKLTAEQVGEIKAALRAGASKTELAERYGVSQPFVTHIAQGKRWKDVP